MGLITGYETIKSRAYYHLGFELDGQEFHMPTGVESPEMTLRLARTLKEKGLSPQISRTIAYDTTKSGYLTRDPEHQDLTLERLEEIVDTNEPLPDFEEPIVSSSYRC